MHITNKFKFNFNVTAPMKIGNMAVFGLTSTMKTKENYLSITEALKNNKALVSEVSEKRNTKTVFEKSVAVVSKLCKTLI